MASLILPSPRVVQPQGPVEINWANPITRGLAWVGTPSSGGTTTVGTIGRSNGTMGRAWETTGVGSSWVSTGYNPPTTGPMTSMALADTRVLGGNRPCIAVGDRATIAWGGGSDVQFYTYDGSSWVGPTVAAPITDGPTLLIGRHTGSQNIISTRVLSGDSAGVSRTASSSVSPRSHSSLELTLGGEVENTGRTTEAHFFLGAFWNRALSDVEVRSLENNPWQLFIPIQRRIWVESAGGGGGITGTLDATESGSDTFAGAGVVIVEGDLASTEAGSDTAALSGTVLVSGALAVTESGSDTAALAGVVLVQGALAVTESGSDTFAATGGSGILGSLNATETGDDTAAIAGDVIVAGTLAVTESGPDTAAISGVVIVEGDLIVTEDGPDTFAAEGSASIRAGTMDAVESGADTAQILGPRGNNLTQASPGLIPKIWPGLTVRYEGKPKRVQQLDEEERERLEEIAEQAVIEAATEKTKKAMKASLQASMRAAEIELAAASYIKLVEQAALLRMEQIEEEEIAVALILM